MCGGVDSTYKEDACPRPCPGDFDGDGVLDDIDLCSGTVAGAAVDPNGCSDAQVDSDGNGVCDAGAPSGGPSGCAPPVLFLGCDTGVADQILPSGATINVTIAAVFANFTNHGQFVSEVTHLANDWKKDGLISGRDKGKITSCVARFS